MKISTIKISGYRQLQNITIDLEDSITIVGGPNNSGKTSLIELFKWVFGKGQTKLQCDDLPILACQKWCEAIFPGIKTAFLSGNAKETVITDVCELLFPTKSKKKPIIIKPVEVRIHVTYDPKTDDIRFFSDYNMVVGSKVEFFDFIYTHAIDKSLFIDNLTDEYEKLAIRIKKLSKIDEGETEEPKRILKNMLLSLYNKSSKNTAYFSDKLYANKIEFKVPNFKNLFNYENIMANRSLDDEGSQKLHTLSKNFIDIASTDDAWKEMMLSLPDDILKPIQEANIKTQVQTTSIKTLQKTIDAISKTDGKHTAGIIIDMDVTESSIQTLLEGSTHAKYQIGTSLLSESSQGLGYSNLIFLHLQLERFKRNMDPKKVNFFVIEEPESHMHPQMQQVFTEFLFKYYTEAKGMQGLITTHSSEVIKKSAIPHLRILRQAKNFTCELTNLRKFYERQKKSLKDFYDNFYAIAFPDIVFADKIILYEGDTERMLIKQGLQEIEELKPLTELYLSYIQVGGAYAFKYVPLLKFLNIKSVIITDLDYEKASIEVQDIKKSPTTNATIKNFSKQKEKNINPTIEELYEWKAIEKPIILDDLICLSYPGEEDGYARTLEEAMLAKKYNITVSNLKTEQEWKDLRRADGLVFTIPRSDNSGIRDIVNHSSSSKTDFMYSVILQKKIQKMFPNYIKEALLWLKN